MKLWKKLLTLICALSLIGSAFSVFAESAESNEPTAEMAEISANTPGNEEVVSTPVDESPAELPAEVPIEAPATETPAEDPIETPATETSAEEPIETPATETSAEAPIEASTDVPADAVTASPAEIPVDTSAENSADAPSDVPTESPSEASSDTPTEAITDTPSESTPAPLRAGWALVNKKTEAWSSPTSSRIVCFLLKDALVQAKELEDSDRAEVKFVLSNEIITAYVKADMLTFPEDFAEIEREYEEFLSGKLYDMTDFTELLPEESAEPDKTEASNEEPVADTEALTPEATEQPESDNPEDLTKASETAAAEMETSSETPSPDETPAPTMSPTPVPTDEPAVTETPILIEDDPESRAPSGLRLYVERCYNLILNRAGEESGILFWIDQISSGRMGGAAVVRGFVNSDEFKSRHLSNKQIVTIMYRTMLGREPDEGGMNFWLSYLDVGMSPDAIVAGFAESQEFGGICAGYGVLPGTYKPSEWRDQSRNVTAFVQRAYNLILQRTGEAGGLNTWCCELLQGRMTGADIVMQFMSSAEFAGRHVMIEDLVTILYRTMLNRYPEASGLQNWIDHLREGWQVSEIINGFSMSAEFNDICSGYGIWHGNVDPRTAPHVHSWDVLTIYTTANCRTPGKETHICLSCGLTQTLETPKLNHTTKIVTTPYQAPTCTEDGHSGGSWCEICHAVVTASTPVSALGHNWTAHPDGIPLKQICSRCSLVQMDSNANYRALLVGNGKYTASGYKNLDGPYGDLRNMQTMLNSVNDGKFAGKVSTVMNVNYITDLENLINSHLVYGADANTVSVFYYSGHGGDPTHTGTGLIMSGGGRVPFSTLASWLKKVPGKVIVILDCCYSGDGIVAKGGSSDSNDEFNRAVISAFSAADSGIASRSGELRDSKFVVLTASRENQQSWEDNSDGYYAGRFTRTLCNKIGTSGMMSADANGDGVATLTEVFNSIPAFSYGSNYQNAMCYPSGSNYPIVYRAPVK